MCEKDQDFDVAEYFGVKFADGQLLDDDDKDGLTKDEDEDNGYFFKYFLFLKLVF